MPDHSLNEIEYDLTAGLSATDPRVKQFYLERALKRLIPEDRFNRWKEDLEWDNGIPA